ncbi:MAG: hypothetical protein QFX33_03410 [Candidatus Nezhaarchaeota archaeon]|nr:hypothetical protein [Candidatus Nezhaarchaeota archaeon]
MARPEVAIDPSIGLVDGGTMPCWNRLQAGRVEEVRVLGAVLKAAYFVGRSKHEKQPPRSPCVCLKLVLSHLGELCSVRLARKPKRLGLKPSPSSITKQSGFS